MIDAPEETTPAPARPLRLAGAVKVTAALAAGALLVGGGATLARWYDSEDLTASVTTARSAFTLTHDGQTYEGSPAVSGYEVEVEIGEALAREVATASEPVRRQFDLYSLAEGDIGMSPNISFTPSGILAEAEGVAWVSADGSCDGSVPDTAVTIGDWVDLYYPDGISEIAVDPDDIEAESTACIEYQPLDLGSHLNEVTVTGRAATGSGGSTDVSAADEHHLDLAASEEEITASGFEVRSVSYFVEKCGVLN